MLEWQAHSEAGAQKETVSYGVMYITGTHTSHNGGLQYSSLG